jgi:hypothetical protein
MRATIRCLIDGEHKEILLPMSVKEYQIDVYGQKCNLTFRGNDKGEEVLEVYENEPGDWDKNTWPTYLRGDVKKLFAGGGTSGTGG